MSILKYITQAQTHSALVISDVYNHNCNTLHNGVMSHTMQLVFAQSSNMPQTSTQVFINMHSSKRVRILRSLTLTSDLIAKRATNCKCNFSATHIYNKTQVGSIINSNKKSHQQLRSTNTLTTNTLITSCSSLKIKIEKIHIKANNIVNMSELTPTQSIM